MPCFVVFEVCTMQLYIPDVYIMSLSALSTRPCMRGFSDSPRRPINLYIKFLIAVPD